MSKVVMVIVGFIDYIGIIMRDQLVILWFLIMLNITELAIL